MNRKNLWISQGKYKSFNTDKPMVLVMDEKTGATVLEPLYKTKITEEKARLLNYCVGCGDEKPAGEGKQVVCWECWRREDLPYKYYQGTLQEWIDELKNK